MASSSKTTPSYQYSPLGPSPLGDEIRLIRLWPGPFTADEIELEILHATKEPRPEFEALSYAWGDPKHTDGIYVKRKTTFREERITRLSSKRRNVHMDASSVLPIAHNLAIALRHLRSPEKSRILWVDAICINQSDDEEKSREVLQMGAVYSNAKDVIVWLGPSADNSTLALETLARLGEGVDFYPAEHEVKCRSGSWAETLRDDEQALQAESPSWMAIGSLLRREWFGRLWVFQEIALASSSGVVAGNYSIDWELFRLGVWWVWTRLHSLNRLVQKPNIEDPGTNCIQGLLEVSDRNRTVQTDLIRSLLMTRMASCSDKRDRLFGIRDLLRVEDRHLIEPDYSLPTEEVYKVTAIKHITSRKRLDILKLCMLQNSSLDLKVPSWVPDFSFQDRPEPIAGTDADGVALASHSVEDEDVLIVHGVQVAVIREVLASGPTKESTDKELVDACRTRRQHLRLSDAYVAGGSMEDAFIEAVMCGKTQETAPENSGASPVTDACKHVLLADEEFEKIRDADTLDGRDRALVMAEMRRMSYKRAFFSTAEGHVGMCPDSAQCGDVVVVVLGCGMPLVLRPQISGEGRCQIVGECYVPGIMNTEALLGPLPPEWTMRKLYDRSDFLMMIYEQENIKTRQDPRIDDLPPGWRIMFGTLENPLEVEPEDEKEWEPLWFENLVTGERTFFNPALTPELLRDRGVDIQEFKLI